LSVLPGREEKGPNPQKKTGSQRRVTRRPRKKRAFCRGKGKKKGEQKNGSPQEKRTARSRRGRRQAGGGGGGVGGASKQQRSGRSIGKKKENTWKKGKTKRIRRPVQKTIIGKKKEGGNLLSRPSKNVGARIPQQEGKGRKPFQQGFGRGEKKRSHPQEKKTLPEKKGGRVDFTSGPGNESFPQGGGGHLLFCGGKFSSG